MQPPSNLDPESGELIRLMDGGDTKVRQVLASDYRLGIHEVRDDRGQIIYISSDGVPGLWVELSN